MKKFIQYTAIFGAVLSVLGFGTAWAAKINGGNWEKEELFDTSFVRFSSRRGHSQKEDVFVQAVEQWEKEIEGIERTEGIEGEIADIDIVTEGTGLGIEAEGMEVTELEPVLRFPMTEELNLNIGGGEVLIKTGAVSEIQIFYDQAYLNRKNNWIDIDRDEDGEELNIQVKKTAKSHVQDYPQVLILLPEDGQFHSVDISLAAGNFQALGLKAEELDVEVAAGNAEISESTIYSGDFECVTGNLFYSGIINGDVSGQCAMGNIELSLRQKESDFNYELQGVGGTIRIGDSELGGLAFERKIFNHSVREMDLECSAGSIMVDFSE